jgi:GTP pyrophosphokinase
LKKLIKEIREKVCLDLEIMQPPTGALNRFFLDSLDPVCIKFSQCCEPNPTENALMGLLSERGLSVHKQECIKLQSLALQREDVVELRWKLKETRVRKPQTIIIPQGDGRGRIFMMVGVAPEEMRVQDVIALSALPDGKMAWEINFTVSTLADLKKTLAHFKKAGVIIEFVLEQ